MRKSFILVYTIISSLLLNAQTHADFEWAHSMGSSNADEGASIKIDNFGNVYTIGTFEGTVDFDPSAATFNLTSQGQTDIFITKFSASGDFIWAKALEGTGADYGDGIDVDALGNVYTTGRFTGTTDFDPNAGTFNITSQGSNDIFISKLDAAGNFVWAKSIGGGSSDYGKSIALDASGNIYVTGAFQATVDFDPGIGTFNLSAVGTWDVFVLKLNTVGDFVWAKSFGGTSNDEGRKIAVDGSGNIYTTGFYSSTTDFNPNAGTFNITSQGSADVFISKLDASGNFVWAKSIGGTSADHGYGLTLDALGNVLITGRFNNSVDFDPGAGVYNLSSQGNADVFILKLDALGDFVWAKTLGGTAADYGQSITVDINNNIYITGYFNGTVDFDPGVGVKNISSLGGTDVFILKLDANGNFVWAKSIGGTGADVGNAIAVNVSNDVYTTGKFENTVDFDPNDGVFNLTSNGAADIFIHKMSQCTQTTATISPNACTSYTSPSGQVLTISGTYMDTIPNIAGCDSVITIVLNINHPTSGIATITACDNYTWIDGNTYTASNNTATYTLTNVAGCDSVVTLNLTINNPTTGTDIQTACGSLTWIDGNTYTTSNNTATHTIVGGAANGCDSIVTLNLTINNPTTGTDIQTACGSYTWIDGNTYTTSNNTATHTIVGGAANGCDSIVTLNLTINNSTTGTDTQTACSSFTWIDGNTYTTSNNTATHTIVGGAANGCDSIVTLNLTINNSTAGTDIQTACGSYTWIDGNTYTTSNNTATHTIVGGAANGCDSIVTLNLTINNSTTGTDTQTACGSFTWIDGNTYTTSNNTATYTIIGGAANGCDSIVTLNLTINNPTTGTDIQTACGSFTWIDGNTYTLSNNTATYTLTNVAGCDSVVTLNLTIQNVDVNVNVNSITLAANASGLVYKWIDCSNNSAIPGATNQSFTATANGNYAVVVTDGACSDTSACHTITTVSLHEQAALKAIQVYPNPASSFITVASEQTEIVALTLLDNAGRIVYQAVPTNTNYQIPVAQLTNGLYLLHLETKQGTTVRLVEVQH